MAPITVRDADDIEQTVPTITELMADNATLFAALQSALQTALETIQIGSIAAGDNNIGNVDVASSALPAGAATAANQSSEITLVGAVTESAPGTDIASSGLNGRLQRIAQRITSLIALVPTALTGSGNFKTALQEAIPAGTNAIGTVDTTPGTPNIITVTTVTSATQFTSIAAKLIDIKARAINTGLSYIGDANDVTASNGYELAPGESTGWMPYSNLNLLWHFSTNATDKLDVKVKV